MPARIVFLHYTAPPVIGGVEAVISQQARLLDAAGYSTLVLAGRSAPGPTGLPTATRRALIPEIDSEHPENIAVTAEVLAGQITDRFSALQNIIQASLEAILLPEDVVIVHNALTLHLNLPLVAALHSLAKLGRLPRVVVWCHDLARNVNPASGAPQYQGWPWDLLRQYHPDFYYVAVSTLRQTTLAQILQCPVSSIEVIPNGVEPDQLLGLSGRSSRLAAHLDWFNVDVMILMPIRITRAKNIEFGLRVTASLKNAGLHPRLVITGPPDPHSIEAGQYFASIQTLRSNLALDQEVHFLCEDTSAPPLDISTVAELYRLCDLVLMPSLREGFGMPVLEAALVDRPIFATAMPIVNELQPGFEYTIAPDESPDSVSRRIQDWAAHDAAHQLRRRVRRSYTWSAIYSRQLEPLIQRVIKRQTHLP